MRQSVSSRDRDVFEGRIISETSLAEIKNQFHHRLVGIWKAFKADFGSPALSEFDDTVADLADFEDIRYPDEILKRGAQITIDYHAQVDRTPSLRKEPEYRLDFYDLDRLIGVIFDVSDENPEFYFSGLKPDVKEMLGRDNPIAEFLFPQRNKAEDRKWRDAFDEGECC